MSFSFIIGPLIEIAGKIFDRVIPDKAAADRAKQEFIVTAQTQEFQLILEQLKINVEEAKSANWFVAGWRPFVGWTCGVALAYTYIVLPFMQFFVYSLGSPEVVESLTLLPVLDLGQLLPILLGMLGLGALRTWEKLKDSEGNR